MFKTALFFILSAYIGAGVFLYFYQHKLLYFPVPERDSHYADMTIKSDGESIHIIVLNKGKEDAILYFGGNAESVAQSADEIAKEFSKYTVYLMEYRGYGKSTGEASERALYHDALKLYDIVKPLHKHIFVSGRSLGTGIATYVAAHREVQKLVLITPYDSIVNVAQQRYPLYPVSLMLKDRYDSLSRVKDIEAKTLIMAAQNDKVVPWDNTKRLIDAFDKKRVEAVTVKERGHNDISLDNRYYPTIRNFLERGE